MAKVQATVTGKDAELIQWLARSLCHWSGSNCTRTGGCPRRSACRMQGWTGYVSQAELILKVIREKHVIIRKIYP